MNDNFFCDRRAVGLRICRLFMLMVVCFSAPAMSQQNGYFIGFTDKKGTAGEINHPESYLSQQAIVRRMVQGIAIDSSDLPVSSVYINELKGYNLTVAHTSKWLNGAIVMCNDASVISELSQLPFVKMVEMTKGYASASLAKQKQETIETMQTKSMNLTDYGDALAQISTVNGLALHEKGYRGAGKLIAVIDAGFYHANSLPLTSQLFDNGKIMGQYDFVNPAGSGDELFEQYQHGMHVLSIIGGNNNGSYLGTAPDADFWLMRTEDSGSEFPIEADYWACAAEMADSAGVDIINTSLGYSTFDNSSFSLTYSQLDGTSRISTAASMAVQKGMVVVVSAGNEGNRPWHYILTPSDARDVLTVGAMAADSTLAAFSSVGPTADGRIKPDVVAMGHRCAIQGITGTVVFGSGTSYAAPVVTGLIACLWQALPDYTASEIIDLVKQSANGYSAPNASWGYGIPDFGKALQMASHEISTSANSWHLAVNPVHTYLVAENKNVESDAVWAVALFDIFGQELYSGTNAGPVYVNDQVGKYPAGIYLLQLKGAEGSQVIKFVKQ
jgi:hypothetical protein